MTPDRYRLAIIVADEFTGTDERFGHALHSAPARLILKPVGGDFLSLFPGGRKRRVPLSKLIATGPASASDSDCGSHAASISESLQEALTPCRDKFAPFHRTGSHRTSTGFFRVRFAQRALYIDNMLKIGRTILWRGGRASSANCRGPAISLGRGGWKGL